MKKSLLLAGVMGAALAALIMAPAMAQPVQTDPQGFSPYNTHGTLDENINNTNTRQAPALSLSGIYGLNPCSLGASAGITTPLFGIAGAISTTDKECETRNTAALAITGLKDEAAAREVMCGVKEFREAVSRLGKPCIVDMKVATIPPPQQPVAQQTPVVLTSASAPATKPTKPAAILPNAPAFCQIAGLVLSAYPECTQPPAATVASEGKRPTVVGRDPHQIVRAVEKKPEATADKKAPLPVNPDLNRQIPNMDRPLNKIELEPTAGQPNSVATLMQRRATMLAANDTAAVRLIDERIAALGAPVTPPPDQRIITAQPAQPQERSGETGMVATLMQRGAAMVAANDIVAARMLYERAVTLGSGRAAVELAKSYDPHLHSVGANPMLAENWYRRAIAMGEAEAANLSRLASR